MRLCQVGLVWLHVQTQQIRPSLLTPMISAAAHGHKCACHRKRLRISLGLETGVAIALAIHGLTRESRPVMVDSRMDQTIMGSIMLPGK